MNDDQNEVFAIINYVILHSNLTATEMIEVLATQQNIIKEALANGK